MKTLAPLILALVAAPAAADQPGYAFDVVITLSPAAQARLATPAEGIVVDARYFGDPNPDAVAQTDAVGQITMGQEQVTLGPAAGIAHLTGDSVNPEAATWIRGPARVNVNAWSARRSDPENILACDFFDGVLDRATMAPVELYCSLIDENVATRVKS